MSVNVHPADAESPVPKFSIVVHAMSDGSIAIQGLTGDKLACLGLLEAAKFAILTQPLPTANRVLVPSPRFSNGR